MYQRADIIFVVAWPVVRVPLYVLQVFYHMAEKVHIVMHDD